MQLAVSFKTAAVFASLTHLSCQYSFMPNSFLFKFFGTKAAVLICSGLCAFLHFIHETLHFLTKKYLFLYLLFTKFIV